MRFRKRAFGRSRGKRTVAWTPGVTGFDSAGGTDWRLLTFAPITTGSNIWGAAIQVTNDSDLQLHGGEDAVVQRIRGHLLFTNTQKDAGAGLAAYSAFSRVLIVQTDTTAAGLVMPFEFTSSEGLGRDDILHMQSCVLSQVVDGATQNGLDSLFSVSGLTTIYVDSKAQRKIQSDRHILLWIQTLLPGGTTGFQTRMRGELRTLLKRPR